MMILRDLERLDARGQFSRTVWPTAIKFGMVTNVGKGVFVRGQGCLPFQGAWPQRAPILGGTPYLCLHPVT